ncbi:MAG: hypothetical protein A2900_04860 [Candidatus Chisholmbacteria bacterium RIFCSPLOWO2_01_FULL_50_28]|uniref:Uncharacterized protein n=1 Tax=Candidatus Chisholmbacteria bacterium RIFCSPHIGHO2_01_FULL_52_32 TaxID=1797591 RepID=A0A1G1VS78_9BACT|nr:MAG: hypothetical protein A2786_01885 [Candidatus Chisholmbacteria bacterium RIFCSPHIGHO2_01_FULL_52_32]OGY20378.1 MAG: hypothetical protein A2900_04860 [Candidatus Chisholmbacteria bacterium RIFCSPLOWO2_01_FULL_50_28]
MPKRIVTHLNPDLDAITSVWLLTRFGGKDFADASVQFVPAGERLPEEDANTVHVDTGLGEFDHHQNDKRRAKTCSAKLIYEWLERKGRVSGNDALRRLVDVVNEIDHFKHCHWPEADNDRYEFFLEEVLAGLKTGSYVRSDNELLLMGMRLLDGVLVSFRHKVAAEEELSKGIVFDAKIGKILVLETGNDTVMKLALKKGYALSVRRDPKRGAIRIKADPTAEIDLTPVYDALRRKDAEATWYLHPSRHMILNGSTRNPKMRPSKLTLADVIGILKETDK